MDDCRFDNWTRMLGALQDRRAALKEMVAAGVALVALARADLGFAQDDVLIEGCRLSGDPCSRKTSAVPKSVRGASGEGAGTMSGTAMAAAAPGPGHWNLWVPRQREELQQGRRVLRGTLRSERWRLPLRWRERHLQRRQRLLRPPDLPDRRPGQQVLQGRQAETGTGNRNRNNRND